MHLFDEMQQHGLQPEVITYSTQIRACRKGKTTERSLHVFVKMQQQGKQPNIVTYDKAVGRSAAISEKDRTTEV